MLTKSQGTITKLQEETNRKDKEILLLQQEIDVKKDFPNDFEGTNQNNKQNNQTPHGVESDKYNKAIVSRKGVQLEINDQEEIIAKLKEQVKKYEEIIKSRPKHGKVNVIQFKHYKEGMIPKKVKLRALILENMNRKSRILRKNIRRKSILC